MKIKYLLIISILFFSKTSSFAQDKILEFESGNKEYIHLKDPIVISENENWADDFWKEIDIGFSFNFLGEIYNKARIRSGGIDFPNGKGILSRRIFALYRMLKHHDQTQSRSEISFKTEFDIGLNERICKIEWKNAGLTKHETRITKQSDYINIQVWLHETSCRITYHFGENNISEESYLANLYKAGPLGIKLFIDGKLHSPTGNGDNPIYVVEDASSGKYPNIESYPSNGTYYCFEPH